MLKKIIICTLTLFSLSSFSIAQDSIYNGDIIDNQAVSILLKISGVEGESEVYGHEGEIDLLTWNWGITQSGSMHVGGGGGSGKAFVEDVELIKYVDKASPNLMLACLKGGHFSEAILTVVRSGQDFDYIQITLSPVLVTSVITSGTENYGLLSEKVTLNFAKVKFSYTPTKADGTADAAIDFTWNIEKNTQE